MDAPRRYERIFRLDRRSMVNPQPASNPGLLSADSDRSWKDSVFLGEARPIEGDPRFPLIPESMINIPCRIFFFLILSWRDTFVFCDTNRKGER